ncbi:MAG TPA: exodeoxyribonuclease VII small subunit, partial [Allocoleopsis sp.]
MTDQSGFMEANSDSSFQITPAASGEEGMPPSWKYEETVIEIESIIQQIETGELELAQVFDQFSIAVQRLR